MPRRSFPEERSRLRLRVCFSILAGLAFLYCGCATRGPQRIFERNIARHPDQGAVIHELRGYDTHGPQDEFSALAIIFRHWRFPLSPADIQARSTELSSRRGLSFGEALSALAEERDLWAFETAMPMSRLQEWIRSGVPVIAPLQNQPLAPGGRSFAVVFGYNAADGTLLVFDGSLEAAVIPAPAFIQRWGLQRYSALILVRTDAVYPSLTGRERLSRAGFYRRTLRYDQAISDCQESIAAGFEPGLSRMELGRVYWDMGRMGEAEREFREALKCEPLNAQAFNNLAYLLADRRRNLDEAIRLAQQAVYLDPANPAAWDTLGFAFLRQGRLKEAEQALERARTKALKSPTEIRVAIALHLVEAYVESGQEHLARQVLADILSMAPDFVVPDALRFLHVNRPQ